MEFHIETSANRPDLEKMAVVHFDAWPRFALEDSAANRYWGRLHQDFPEYQFYVCDDAGTVLAECNSIPVTWDGEADSLPDDGFNAMLTQGVQNYDSGIQPDTLCALGVTIGKQYQGRGISRYGVQGMADIARKQGFKALIAPVRPSMKDRYPLIPMQNYVHWKRDDSLPFDPWIRVHVRLGASILKVAPSSMHISGTIAQWEEWANMRFPESGLYTMPGALVPVQIDCEADNGRYIEPNVWMLHTISSWYLPDAG